MDEDEYRLKKGVCIGGKLYDIRNDYSVMMDISKALDDPNLDDQERAYIALDLFYPDFNDIPTEHFKEALDKCMDFLSAGMPKGNMPKLISWEKDFPLIVGAINRILGYDIRSIPYDVKNNTGGVSWETVISAFREIGGDCLWAQVVGIRYKLAMGKPLDKSEREWYYRNRELVDIPTKYSKAEEEFLRELGGA